MSNFDLNGVDYSSNAINGTTKSLLATIPQRLDRRGYIVQNQDATENVYVVFDDTAGSLTATTIILAAGGTAGSQGGNVTLTGMPHTGRIRIYGDSVNTKMAAREWH